MQHITAQDLIQFPPQVDDVLHQVETTRVSYQVTDDRDGHTVAWIVPDDLMRALAPGLFI